MKNLAIIAVVAWLLFGGGLSQVKNLQLGNAPQTIITGAQRTLQTAQPAATPRPAPARRQPPAGAVIVPARMPVLPTATPVPEPAPVVEQPAPAPVAIPETPIVFVASPADCLPLAADHPCWAQFGEVTGASPDCFPLPASDPCWKQND